VVRLRLLEDIKELASYRKYEVQTSVIPKHNWKTGLTTYRCIGVGKTLPHWWERISGSYQTTEFRFEHTYEGPPTEEEFIRARELAEYKVDLEMLSRGHYR